MKIHLNDMMWIIGFIMVMSIVGDDKQDIIHKMITWLVYMLILFAVKHKDLIEKP